MIRHNLAGFNMIQDDLWHLDLMDKLGLNQPTHGEHDFYGSKHAQMSPASCVE